MSDNFEYQTDHIDGMELERIAVLMTKHVGDENPLHVVMSAIGIAILIQDPNIEPDQLSKGIFGASEWIASFLHTLHSVDEEVKDYSKLN